MHSKPDIPVHHRRRRVNRLHWSAALLVLLTACSSSGSGAAPGSTGTDGHATTADPSSTVPAASTVESTVPPAASLLPAEATIVFQARVPGADKIALQSVGGDGSGQRELAAIDSGLQRHGDWSPDGTRLVFTASDAEGTDDLWVARADGSSPTKVVECAAPCLGVDEAAWSPDGTTLVYERVVQPGDTATCTLELLDVASGTITTLYTAPANSVLLAPRWSPDGRRLVVEWLQLDGPGDAANPIGDLIGMLDLDHPEAGVQPLTEPEQWANNPDWSKDGEWLLFAARVPGKGTFQDLYVSRPDGTEERRITTLADDGDMAVQPTFSPDGRYVLFVNKPGGGFEGVLTVVDLRDGTVAAIGGDEPVGGEHPRLRPQP